MLANFIIGLPYLCKPPLQNPSTLSLIISSVLIDVIFSVIAYWLGNFQPTPQAFFMWIMWLFLDLVAAESLVVLVSSIFPNFVISLALTAFANGLWMSVNGFMVSPKLLNVFWRYVFHYIDYQAYGKPLFQK
jgi:ABC-type multidrug transport system permease subunit